MSLHRAASTRRLAQLALVLAVLGLALGAEARPGGGHTFGGGSSSSHSYGSGGSRSHGGGSGGGGDAELLFWIVRLIFAYPKLGVPLVLLVLYLWFRAKNAAPESWTSSHAAPPHVARSVDYGALRAADPDFSRVIFDDFVYRLYATTQRSRHAPQALSALAPYLSEDVRRGLAQDGARGAVSHVVVGALRTLSVSDEPGGEQGGSFHIQLELESNLTVNEGPSARTDYVVERWTLMRARGVRTKAPEETARLGCPSCGAPFEAGDQRRCAYCGQVVEDGRFAWTVVQRSELRREARPPALTGSTAESGTDTPTVRAPDAEPLFADLCRDDPALDPAALEARLGFIYDALNRGWSAAELTPVRGLVSDGMFDYLRYWVDAYVAQGLRNQLREMHIARVERVKVVRDRWYDAVTYRLWASGYDATVDAKSGALVGGSDRKKRAYTEYWTLIRARGVSGSARRDASCPSCGAPLEVTMAGACKHCGSHVTRGEFDWVLSKIEQDDVYAG
jgi:Tim44-like domain